MSDKSVDYADVKAAHDAATKPSAFRKLADKNDPNLNVLLAFNFATPVSILKKLAKIKDARIAEGLSANSAAPMSIKSEILDRVLKEAKKLKHSQVSQYKSTVMMLLPYIETKKIDVSKKDLYTLVLIYKPEATNLEILAEIMRLQGGKLKRRKYANS